MSDEPVYRLVSRRAGTAFYGLTITQLLLAATGVAGLAVAAVTVGGQIGLLLGATVLAGSVGLAVVQVGGEPLHALLPLLARYALTRHGQDLAARAGRRGSGHRPPPAASPAAGGLATSLPGGLLAGLGVHGIELGDGPPGALPTVGGPRPAVIRHRSGALTVVVDVRGGPFTLLDTAEQHRALAAWARVLAQTARTPGVLTVGWTLHTHHTHADHPRKHLPQIGGASRRPPADRAGHPDRSHSPGRDGHSTHQPRRPPAPAAGRAAPVALYERLLDDTLLQQHDLRLWITIDPRRAPGRARRTGPEQVAVEAAGSLAARAADAGLTIHGALAPARLTTDLTRHLDPTAPRHATPAQDTTEPAGLAARIGLPGARPATDRPPTPPPATGREVRWDAVRTGRTWHRTFWVAGWPTGPLHPGWLEPLLHESPSSRTLTVAFTPLSARASRKRLNHDTAAADLALQIRDRHAVRVPDQLARAHADIRQRDAELSAGHPELAYLALLDIAAPEPDALDAASAEIADLAARAGIVDLRPLHGRHHHTLAATLPLGLTVRRAHPGAD